MSQSLYHGPVLVTGASRGIGKEVAVALEKEGYTVYCASRSGQVPKESPNLIGLKMDVTNPASIAEAASKVDKLQVLVHCAGYGIAGSVECTPLEEAKKQMETNYFGVLAVSSAFLPKLRKNKRSLMIVTGSFAGLLSIPFQSHYSASKFALEAFVEALRLETKEYGVQAVIIEPGDTKTSFTAKRECFEPESSVYYEQMKRSVNKMAEDEQNGKSPVTVAKLVCKLLKKKNVPVRVQVCFTYKLLGLMAKFLPSLLVEKILKKLYIC